MVLLTLFFTLFLSLISLADTFEVTNLNDPGVGSLRNAIDNSNSTPGADKIVFVEGLEGTLILNLGSLQIHDDLTIIGPGADKITIDADEKTNVFNITDDDDELNRVVEITGLSFINVNNTISGAIFNRENLTIRSCRFFNCNATLGGTIQNEKILTVDSCLFENNSASWGGAISNEADGINVKIMNSEFRNNEAVFGGAIRNQGTIDLITSSTFINNTVSGEANLAGVIQNDLGTIKEISNCIFEGNSSEVGGAIFNLEGIIENIVNSTFTNNSAVTGSAIRNHGLINISFTTIANNPSLPLPPDSPFAMERGGIVTVGGGVTSIRNSILSSNSPDNCLGFLNDFGGNYSDDLSCGLTGDNSEIILGPLMDNGGPTETMALLGGDPLDGATVNCYALDDIGDPSGVPIGIDQRYFPRPFGTRCDSGAFETQPTASVTITKVTDPSGGTGFDFDSTGFSPLEGCGLRGDGGGFVMNDGDSVSCIVPEGDYSITENIPNGYDLTIICLEAPDNITINNETGEIESTIEGPGSDVDCIFTNVVTGGGNGGCSLAPAGTNYSFPLYLFIPALIVLRRLYKKCRD
jgi:hypothetical protein